MAFMLFDWSHYENGYGHGYWNFTNMCLFGVILFVNLNVFVFSNSFTLQGFLFNFLSTFIFFVLWIY